MQIKQTKNGKLHLEGCKVLKNKAIQIKAEVGPEAASKIPEDEFCKVCFGRSPYTKITEMILALPVTTPEPVVEVKVISPEPAPRRVKIEPKPEPKVSSPVPEPVPVKIEYRSYPTDNPNFLPIDTAGMTHIEVLTEMITRLRTFADDVRYSTRHKRYKALFYSEAMIAIKKMVDTQNADEINSIIDKLK